MTVSVSTRLPDSVGGNYKGKQPRGGAGAGSPWRHRGRVQGGGNDMYTSSDCVIAKCTIDSITVAVLVIQQCAA